MHNIRRSRLILLVPLGFAVVVLGTLWFARNSKTKADMTFQPLGRTTGTDGTPQQVFAISNETAHTVEYVLGRHKTFLGPEGQTNNYLESHVYARVAPWSGTQMALTLPSDGGPWRATLNSRRVLSQAELTARGIGHQLHVVRSNQVFPGWQTLASQEFEK